MIRPSAILHRLRYLFYDAVVNVLISQVDSRLPYTGALYGLYDFFTCRIEPHEENKFEYFFPSPMISKNCSDSIRYKVYFTSHNCFPPYDWIFWSLFIPLHCFLLGWRYGSWSSSLHRWSRTSLLHHSWRYYIPGSSTLFICKIHWCIPWISCFQAKCPMKRSSRLSPTATKLHQMQVLLVQLFPFICLRGCWKFFHRNYAYTCFLQPVYCREGKDELKATAHTLFKDLSQSIQKDTFPLPLTTTRWISSNRYVFSCCKCRSSVTTTTTTTTPTPTTTTSTTQRPTTTTTQKTTTVRPTTTSTTTERWEKRMKKWESEDICRPTTIASTTTTTTTSTSKTHFLQMENIMKICIQPLALLLLLHQQFLHLIHPLLLLLPNHPDTTRKCLPWMIFDLSLFEYLSWANLDGYLPQWIACGSSSGRIRHHTLIHSSFRHSSLVFLQTSVVFSNSCFFLSIVVIFTSRL